MVNGCFERRKSMLEGDENINSFCDGKSQKCPLTGRIAESDSLNHVTAHAPHAYMIGQAPSDSGDAACILVLLCRLSLPPPPTFVVSKKQLHCIVPPPIPLAMFSGISSNVAMNIYWPYYSSRLLMPEATRHILLKLKLSACNLWFIAKEEPSSEGSIWAREEGR